MTRRSRRFSAFIGCFCNNRLGNHGNIDLVQTPPITEQRRWYDALYNDTDPVVLPEQACVVSEILEAIYISAKTGEPYYFNK